MAQIRNVSGQPLDIPGIGEVDNDQVFDVPDADVYSYTASANFEPVDATADQHHAAGAAEEAAAVEAERLARGIPAEDEPTGYDGKPPSAKEVIDVLADAPEEVVHAILVAERQLTPQRSTVITAAEKRLEALTA